MIESHRIEYKQTLNNYLEKEVVAFLNYNESGITTIKNIEDFFTGYSKPINREIMRIYKDLDLVEHLGSGLNRILAVYNKESFVISQNFMKNILISNISLINGGVNIFLKFIKKNPNLKAKQISEFLNTPLRTLQRNLQQLKDEDKIEFVGSPKNGGYFAK